MVLALKGSQILHAVFPGKYCNRFFCQNPWKKNRFCSLQLQNEEKTWFLSSVHFSRESGDILNFRLKRGETQCECTVKHDIMDWRKYWWQANDEVESLLLHTTRSLFSILKLEKRLHFAKKKSTKIFIKNTGKWFSAFFPMSHEITIHSLIEIFFKKFCTICISHFLWCNKRGCTHTIYYYNLMPFCCIEGIENGIVFVIFLVKRSK